MCVYTVHYLHVCLVESACTVRLETLRKNLMTHLNHCTILDESVMCMYTGHDVHLCFVKSAFTARGL